MPRISGLDRLAEGATQLRVVGPVAAIAIAGVAASLWAAPGMPAMVCLEPTCQVSPAGTTALPLSS